MGEPGPSEPSLRRDPRAYRAPDTRSVRLTLLDQRNPGIEVPDATPWALRAGTWNLSDAVHPEDWDLAEGLLLHASQSGTRASAVVRLALEEGRWLPMHLQYAGGTGGQHRHAVQARPFAEASRRLGRLEGREDWFRAVTANVSEWIEVLTPREDGRYACAFVSDAVERMIGVTPEEFLVLNDTSYIAPEDLEAAHRFLGRVARSPLGSRATFPFHALHRDGSRRPMECEIVNRLGDGTVDGLILTMRDVQARVELRERAAWLEALTEHAQDTLHVVDVDGNGLLATRAARTLFGGSENHPPSLRDVLRRVHPEDRQRVRTALAAPRVPDFELQYRASSPGSGWRHVVTRVLDRLHDPVVTGLILTTRDVTQRRQRDRRTGLPNRALLLDRLGQLLAARRGMARARVGMLGFSVQPSLPAPSPEHVDAMLVDAAGRLQDGVRDQDTVARVGEHQLAVLLSDIDGPAVLNAAERLAGYLRAPYDLADVQDRARVHAGLAVDGQRFSRADAMLGAVLTALARAQERDQAEPEAFDPALGAQARRAHRLRLALSDALERGDIRPWLQPIVDLKTTSVAGYEALARWSWNGRPVSPGEFVPAAERGGLVADLDLEMLRRASSLLAASPPDTFLAVNFSALSLREPAIRKRVMKALAGSGLDPTRLHLEVTESALLEGDASDRGVAFLGELRSAGVRIALDDFGTGWSSLSRLVSLPLDAVKIDRSFVAQLGASGPEDAVVPAVIRLADALGLQVVAEGVETEDQAQRLRGFGCTFAQGYLFGRPQAPAAG